MTAFLAGTFLKFATQLPTPDVHKSHSYSCRKSVFGELLVVNNLVYQNQSIFFSVRCKKVSLSAVSCRNWRIKETPTGTYALHVYLRLHQLPPCHLPIEQSFLELEAGANESDSLDDLGWSLSYHKKTLLGELTVVKKLAESFRIGPSYWSIYA